MDTDRAIEEASSSINFHLQSMQSVSRFQFPELFNMIEMVLSKVEHNQLHLHITKQQRSDDHRIHRDVATTASRIIHYSINNHIPMYGFMKANRKEELFAFTANKHDHKLSSRLMSDGNYKHTMEVTSPYQIVGQFDGTILHANKKPSLQPTSAHALKTPASAHVPKTPAKRQRTSIPESAIAPPRAASPPPPAIASPPPPVIYAPVYAMLPFPELDDSSLDDGVLSALGMKPSEQPQAEEPSSTGLRARQLERKFPGGYYTELNDDIYYVCGRSAWVNDGDDIFEPANGANFARMRRLEDRPHFINEEQSQDVMGSLLDDGYEEECRRWSDQSSVNILSSTCEF
jgi:hypothetical protein